MTSRNRCPRSQAAAPLILPRRIAELIELNREGRFRSSRCAGCSSFCCKRGGFAILENVLLAFDLYGSGGLGRVRALGPGLDFRAFAGLLFDPWIRKAGPKGRETAFAAFHARCVSSDGTPIPVPPEGDYWDGREALFARNPGLNRGCVFLSRMLPRDGGDDGKPRTCLLHGPLSLTHLTAKPLDCVFYNCANPGPGRLPSLETKHRWFEALAQAWPGSAKRAGSLLGRIGD